MATAGVANSDLSTPVPEGSIVKCYCHQCSKNFNISEHAIEPKCPYCQSEFIERLEACDDHSADTSRQGRDPEGLEATDRTSSNPRLRHRRADLFYRTGTRPQRGVTLASVGYPAPGSATVLIHHPERPLLPYFNRLIRTNGQGAPPPLMQFPFLHGNLGDYAWGPGGLDNIITRLLNQLDDKGSPPAKKELVDALPFVKYSDEFTNSCPDCAVCKDSFESEDVLVQLPCKHLFHKGCIIPWLQLHDTCPVCRFSINRNESFHEQN